MVKALLENGATFAYTATPAFKTKYDCVVNISNAYSFAFDYSNYLFSAYLIEREGRSAISDEERALVLRLLYERNACYAEELLYLAIMYRDETIYAELQALGVTKIPPSRRRALSGEVPYARLDAYERYDREQLQAKRNTLNDAQTKQMLECLISSMEIERLLLFPSDFYTYDFKEHKDKFITRYCSASLFDFFVKKTNMLDRVKKSELLYALVDQDNAAGLGYAVEEKWIEKDSEAEALLLYAQQRENVSAAVLAVLMNKQNEVATVDIKKSFSLTPSAADLKKIWGTKKQESDGSLIITSYKGTEKDVIIPDKIGKSAVTAIDNAAFDPTASRLTPIQIQTRKDICSVVFPDTITKIPPMLFAGHEALESVQLGAKTESIGRGAFYGCKALEEIVLPDGIHTLGNEAFRGCRALKTINVPKSLTSLSKGAFAASGLEEFVVPDHIAEIGGWLFAECADLKKLTLPKHITEIPDELAYRCGSLRDFTVPEGVTVIRERAFAGSAIGKCVIPEGVTLIEKYAFENCRSLTEIKIPAHTVVENDAFTGCSLLEDESL
jgi:hypothetical protein